MELFLFPLLFPSFCYSVIYRVVSIVSDGRNQSSFVFFYVVFKSLYRCVNAFFDAGKSPSAYEYTTKVYIRLDGSILISRTIPIPLYLVLNFLFASYEINCFIST